jgi:hypothetical protein
MDEPPKKRRLWQLHLLTFVIAVLASGLVLGMNALPRVEVQKVSRDQPISMRGPFDFRLRRFYGWPFPFLLRRAGRNDEDKEWQNWQTTIDLRPFGAFWHYDDEDWRSTPFFDLGGGGEETRWSNMPLIGNLLINGVIILAATFISEWLIRRREGRKP